MNDNTTWLVVGRRTTGKTDTRREPVGCAYAGSMNACPPVADALGCDSFCDGTYNDKASSYVMCDNACGLGADCLGSESCSTFGCTPTGPVRPLSVPQCQVVLLDNNTRLHSLCVLSIATVHTYGPRRNRYHMPSTPSRVHL